MCTGQTCSFDLSQPHALHSASRHCCHRLHDRRLRWWFWSGRARRRWQSTPITNLPNLGQVQLCCGVGVALRGLLQEAPGLEMLSFSRKIVSDQDLKVTEGWKLGWDEGCPTTGLWSIEPGGRLLPQKHRCCGFLGSKRHLYLTLIQAPVAQPNLILKETLQRGMEDSLENFWS